MPIRLLTGKYYSVSEVAKKLSVTRQAILKAITYGRLHSFQFGKFVHLIHERDFEKFKKYR